jgi:hypothetical protein
MPAAGVRLRMPEKRCSGLSSSARAWGPQPHAVVAGLRSIFRAITTACSERPPAGRHARDGTLPRCAFEARSTCRIADACASGTRAARGNRAERGFRGAFRAVRSSCREEARTFLAAWHMSLRVSSYALRRQQGSDAETDFRRAAPAAASRQVERADTNPTGNGDRVSANARTERFAAVTALATLC